MTTDGTDQGDAGQIPTDSKVTELSAHKSSQNAQGHPRQSQIMLALGALGVVFGDIGTSPLYALRASVVSTQGHVAAEVAVMGALSLIFWALIIVVTVKYVALIMRADNNGEGGVLALAALAHRSGNLGRRSKAAIGIAAVIGLALFIGDGMITPAISVLSALEGLSVESRAFAPLVLPISLAVLIGLFLMQSSGTTRIGRLFGPIMVLWFICIGVLGFVAILHFPHILTAIDPRYAITLFVDEPWSAFVALGSVVLAVTGCEALYADMGHFGRRPIQYAWLIVVLPPLVLNYFGQGAAILANPAAASFAFYALAPHWAHYPLVALAAIATIIASQAVISGVFSITQQAVQLGQLPRMEIRHTSATESGQIYVPKMNTYLCVGVVLIVLIFKSSDALAAAYGIAVTGVMVISTILAGVVAARQWGWGKYAILIFGALGLVDLAFLSSNTLKIVQGGWFPLLVAIAVFVIMETWRRGRRIHLERIRNESMPIELLIERADKHPMRVAGIAVFMTARNDRVPGSLLHNLKHNKVLHERIVLLHVEVENTPFVSASRRVEVTKLGKGFFGVQVRYGFFETPDVPAALQAARPFGLVVDIETATFFIGHETLVPAGHPEMGRWRTWLYIWLAQNALSPAKFYHLPTNRVIELGTQISI